MQQFDYEDETSYSLRIQATDQAPPFNTNFANLTLTILDTNDNPPSFSMPAGYVLLVPEGVAVGTAVGTVIATDADGASRGTVRYTLTVFFNYQCTCVCTSYNSSFLIIV